MESQSSQFEIRIIVLDDYVNIVASGSYSLLKANNLFKLSIDNGNANRKSKLLIDVIGVEGHIPVFERFQFSEFLASYRAKHHIGLVDKIAVVGYEPIVHNGRFGETVAVNRGANVRVFTDQDSASRWLLQ